MKTFFFTLLFIISGFSFAQNNYIVKTDDGRRVLLKADYTWEYIDAESSKNNKATQDNVEVKEIAKSAEKNGCKLADDFEEPKLDNKIQNQLKKGRATISHIKKKVAKDYNCTVDDVVLLSASEQKAKGRYDFCANGKQVSYKRVGNSIIENNKFF
ncbi:DUF3157 family protein [Thalassobellus suaedae]|uniref:DUF3157 family protein n=1 Tax=Thalassobellus suaedae TaxID=3074124 RepID=A0ABY9Y6B5_9FLAO|nr:DUF3157 family protein [Flavobacteriaceae bacterium HL-DH10]